MEMEIEKLLQLILGISLGIIALVGISMWLKSAGA
jgi:hypothetical protein